MVRPPPPARSGWAEPEPRPGGGAQEVLPGSCPVDTRARSRIVVRGRRGGGRSRSSLGLVPPLQRPQMAQGEVCTRAISCQMSMKRTQFTRVSKHGGMTRDPDPTSPSEESRPEVSELVCPDHGVTGRAQMSGAGRGLAGIYQGHSEL